MVLSPSNLVWLDAIRDSVDAYLQSKTKNMSSVIDTLETAMPRVVQPSIDITVDVIESFKPNHCFVMSIYPDIDELIGVSASLIGKMDSEYKSPNDPYKNTTLLDKSSFLNIWSGIRKWHIEIDKRILTKYDRMCVSNGSEFVALLCHELGHIHITHPISLIRNYRRQRARFNTFEKLSMSNNKMISKVLLTAFVHTASFRIVTLDKLNNATMEIKADAFIPDKYKPFMISYFENHIMNSPEQSDLVVSSVDFDKEQATAIQFSKDTINLMKTRRGVLKTQLLGTSVSTRSNYIKKLCDRLSKDLFDIDSLTNPKRPIVYESTFKLNSYNREYDNILMEATKVLKSKNIVNDRDISILMVDIEDMSTPEDKLYIINTIYDYIERITDELERKYDSSDLSVKLANDKRIMQLNRLRDTVMSTKVSRNGDHYGLFVKYPDGYEG